MSRKIFISPYVFGALTAYRDVVNIGPITTLLPKFEFESWFYSTLIQSGVDYFEMLPSRQYSFTGSSFIDKRTIKIKPSSYEQVSSVTHKLFADYVPGYDRTKNIRL